MSPEDRESAAKGLMEFVAEIRAGRVSQYVVVGLAARVQPDGVAFLGHVKNSGMVEAIAIIANEIECGCTAPCNLMAVKEMLMALTSAYLSGMDMNITKVEQGPPAPPAGSKPH